MHFDLGERRQYKTPFLGQTTLVERRISGRGVCKACRAACTILPPIRYDSSLQISLRMARSCLIGVPDRLPTSASFSVSSKLSVTQSRRAARKLSSSFLLPSFWCLATDFTTSLIADGYHDQLHQFQEPGLSLVPSWFASQTSPPDSFLFLLLLPLPTAVASSPTRRRRRVC